MPTSVLIEAIETCDVIAKPNTATSATSTAKAEIDARIAVRQLLNMPTASTIVSASTYSIDAARKVAKTTKPALISRSCIWADEPHTAIRPLTGYMVHGKRTFACEQANIRRITVSFFGGGPQCLS